MNALKRFPGREVPSWMHEELSNKRIDENTTETDIIVGTKKSTPTKEVDLLETLKLPEPNAYGKMVRIDRVNALIERAFNAALNASEPRQALDLDTIYLLAEVSGFLLGISKELGERREKIAKDYAEKLRKISKSNIGFNKKNEAE